MTATMAVSKIPVPVRNHDDVARLRAISAKTRLERLREEFQRKLLLEKQEKLYKFYEQKQPHQKIRRFGSGDTEYGQHRNPQLTTAFFQQKEAILGRCGSGDALPNTIPNRKPPLPAYTKKSAGRDRAHPLAPINPARLINDSPKTRDMQVGKSGSQAYSEDNLGTTYTFRKPNTEAGQEMFVPRPPATTNRPRITRPRVHSKSKGIDKDAHVQPVSGISTYEDQRNLEKLKQYKLQKLNGAISNGSDHLWSKVDRNMQSEADDEVHQNKSSQKKNSGPSNFEKLEQSQKRPRRHDQLNGKVQSKEGLLLRDVKLDKLSTHAPQRYAADVQKMSADAEDDNDGQDNFLRRQKQQILQRHNRMRLGAEQNDEDDDDSKKKKVPTATLR